jgi:hypothetical protein
MKRKDALTDLVEHAQGAASAEPVASSSDDRQVVNQQGETITLGQKPTSNVVVPNKAIPLELSDRQKEIAEAKTSSIAEEVVNRFLAKRKNK